MLILCSRRISARFPRGRGGGGGGSSPTPPMAEIADALEKDDGDALTVDDVATSEAKAVAADAVGAAMSDPAA